MRGSQSDTSIHNMRIDNRYTNHDSYVNPFNHEFESAITSSDNTRTFPETRQNSEAELKQIIEIL